MLNQIRIILVNTSHPGNIGATARAMKTMGLTQLYLVEPKYFPHADATARASGAGDVLANAVICKDLISATAGCVRVYGLSARRRTVSWPEFSVAQMSADIENISHPDKPAAIVFGRENSGLTNEELDLCQYLVHIPSVADFASLNIAAAVQIVCYELRCQYLESQDKPTSTEPSEDKAGSTELEGFFTHLEDTLNRLAFIRMRHSSKLLRQIRRLFYRADMSKTEVHILRGFLTAINRRIKQLTTP